MIKFKEFLALLPLPFKYVFGAGAIVLFAAGYISNAVIGNNNPVEQMAENLLKNEYGVVVEFSNEHK